MKHLIILLAIIMAAPIGGSIAGAQCERQRFTLDAVDVNGEAVAIDGDVAVVGAGKQPGVAYVYRLRDGRWVEEQVLSSSGGYGQFFGRSVSISGNVIVVGDSFAGPKASAGTAYVFRYVSGGWTQEAELIPSDLDYDDTFGTSVAVSGDVVVVGADRDDDSGENSGSAYVFRFNGFDWVEEAKLVAYDGAADDGFGSSVAADGAVVVVGAARNDEAGSDSGAAYVFGYDGSSWVEERKLTPADGAAGAMFGYSVSVSGDAVFVGAFRHGEADEETGAVYVFQDERGRWTERQVLTASDAEAGDWFGVSVSVSQELAVIGASLDDGDAGTYSGSVYVFAFDGVEWNELNRITPSSAWGVSHFGSSVAVSGHQVVVGADDRLPHISASAYAFDLEGDDCDENLICDGSDAGGYVYRASSFRFSPVGTGWQHDFILPSPPRAAGDVQLTIKATSDLDQPDEWLDVWVNKVKLGSVFSDTGGVCSDPPDHAVLILGADYFNDLRSEEMAFRLVASTSVNPLVCGGGSSAGMTIWYNTIPAGDCNDTGVLDVCDLAMGVSEDANADGIPDECARCSENANCFSGNVCEFVQCVAGVCNTRPATYGDLVGVGGICGPDGQVGVHDILAVFDAFGGKFTDGCALVNADIAGAGGSCVPDGMVDLMDIFAVLGGFHGVDPCCTSTR